MFIFVNIVVFNDSLLENVGFCFLLDFSSFSYALEECSLECLTRTRGCTAFSYNFLTLECFLRPICDSVAGNLTNSTNFITYIYGICKSAYLDKLNTCVHVTF